MTSMTPEIEAVELPTDDEQRGGLFHVAANDLEDARADAGLSWRTLCGQQRPPMKQAKPFELDAETCNVCAELHLGGAR